MISVTICYIHVVKSFNQINTSVINISTISIPLTIPLESTHTSSGLVNMLIISYDIHTSYINIKLKK